MITVWVEHAGMLYSAHDFHRSLKLFYNENLKKNQMAKKFYIEGKNMEVVRCFNSRNRDQKLKKEEKK